MQQTIKEVADVIYVTWVAATVLPYVVVVRILHCGPLSARRRTASQKSQTCALLGNFGGFAR